MIAVTGANGLLGRFIIDKLIGKNIPVTAIIRKSSVTDLPAIHPGVHVRHADVLNVPDLMENLEGITAVIHTAAMVSFDPRMEKKIFEVNTDGTRNVVNTCLALGIPRLIHVSSVAALGRQKGITQIDEESKWVTSPLNSHYAASKHFAEIEVFRGMEEGLKVSIVNPSVILAPSDWMKSSAQLFRYVWKGGMFYPDGSLNFVDVRDVADMIFSIYEGDYNGDRFILNAGVVPMKYFMEEVARRFGKKAPAVRLNPRWAEFFGRMEEIRSFLAGSSPLITRQSVSFAKESFQYSNQKAKEKLGFEARSLEDTLDWCCDAYLRKISTNK